MTVLVSFLITLNGGHVSADAAGDPRRGGSD